MPDLMFGFKPRWFDKVVAVGTPASATVISDPKDVMKGVAGYEGGERYFDVVVRVGATYDGVPRMGQRRLSSPVTVVARNASLYGGEKAEGSLLRVHYSRCRFRASGVRMRRGIRSC